LWKTRYRSSSDFVILIGRASCNTHGAHDLTTDAERLATAKGYERPLVACLQTEKGLSRLR
jgi:hypothetical protein